MTISSDLFRPTTNLEHFRRIRKYLLTFYAAESASGASKAELATIRGELDFIDRLIRMNTIHPLDTPVRPGAPFPAYSRPGRCSRAAPRARRHGKGNVSIHRSLARGDQAMNRTTRIERARSTCDSAEWLKSTLSEPFMRVVLQNTVNHVRRTIRRGDIDEIEREATVLREMVDRYREMSYA